MFISRGWENGIENDRNAVVYTVNFRLLVVRKTKMSKSWDRVEDGNSFKIVITNTL